LEQSASWQTFSEQSLSLQQLSFEMQTSLQHFLLESQVLQVPPQKLDVALQVPLQQVWSGLQTFPHLPPQSVLVATHVPSQHVSEDEQQFWPQAVLFDPQPVQTRLLPLLPPQATLSELHVWRKPSPGQLIPEPWQTQSPE
jgi:hypothetical protein